MNETQSDQKELKEAANGEPPGQQPRRSMKLSEQVPHGRCPVTWTRPWAMQRCRQAHP